MRFKFGKSFRDSYHLKTPPQHVTTTTPPPLHYNRSYFLPATIPTSLNQAGPGISHPHPHPFPASPLLKRGIRIARYGNQLDIYHLWSNKSFSEPRATGTASFLRQGPLSDDRFSFDRIPRLSLLSATTPLQCLGKQWPSSTDLLHRDQIYPFLLCLSISSILFLSDIAQVT